VHRICILFALSLGLSCALAGCSPTSGLKARAAAYYSFMAGLTPKVAYSSFMSPAYRKTFQRSDLDQLNKTYARAKTASDRYKRCKPADVSVTLESRFAITVANPELGDAYRNLLPIRWVRVGSGWYLYSGSKSELEEYGEFPGGIAPPRPGLTDRPSS